MTNYQLSTYRNSDLRIDLREHPQHKDLLLDIDGEAVKRSIMNLLFTAPYERRFRPALGSGLKKYLFEPITKTTADSIKNSIITTIKNYEKRAEIVDVLVNVSPDYNSYLVIIIFKVINRVEPITINTLLERIR